MSGGTRLEAATSLCRDCRQVGKPQRAAGACASTSFAPMIVFERASMTR
jgi:hypothetical protein